MNEEIIRIISDQLQIDPDIIGEDTDIMEELGADSLDAVEIIMSIEENFGISIPDEDIEKLRSVNDISRYVEARISK